jgi:hypothetical protein
MLTWTSSLGTFFLYSKDLLLDLLVLLEKNNYYLKDGSMIWKVRKQVCLDIMISSPIATIISRTLYDVALLTQP